jgi:predicted nucleic acid-binding protein
MPGALLDTSVWVAYLRPGGPQLLKDEISQQLASNEAYSCSVIRMELLVGARDEAAFNRLEVLLRSLPDVAIEDALWQGAARLGFGCRKAGLSVPLPDLLIARAAMLQELEVWHLDSHYERIAQFAPLRTRSFLAAV